MAGCKVICSGNIIEVWHYQYELNDDSKEHIKSTEKHTRDSEAQTMYLLTGDITYMNNLVKPEWLKEYLKFSQTKRNKAASKANFRRVVLMNFTSYANFITLTFRDGATYPDGEEINIKDIIECNKYFDQVFKKT